VMPSSLASYAIECKRNSKLGLERFGSNEHIAPMGARVDRNKWRCAD
jgi:hypothetical protein